jgi:sporulation protein YlmC with PRC-barrel domain
MKAEDITKRKVVEVARGSEVGPVSGLLIDTEAKRIAAIAIGGTGMLAEKKYVRYEDIISIEHDALTIPSVDVLVHRKDIRPHGLAESLEKRRVLTEDGRELGTVQSYSIDPRSGDISSITFSVNKQVLGGLWKTAGDTYDISQRQIKTLGDNVIVGSSVPDEIGMNQAA